MACTTDYDSNTATSSACGTAFEEQLACAAALSCEEFTAWTGHMGEYPCKSADDELTTACTGSVPEACTSSCEVVAMCTQGSQPQCEAACTQGLEMFEAIGPQCVTDQTSLLECVAGLDCAQYELYDAGAGEYPCKSEADAAQLSCME
jgi:hypothetical protein